MSHDLPGTAHVLQGLAECGDDNECTTAYSIASILSLTISVVKKHMHAARNFQAENFMIVECALSTSSRVAVICQFPELDF